jgi:hypothetical protein
MNNNHQRVERFGDFLPTSGKQLDLMVTRKPQLCYPKESNADE